MPRKLATPTKFEKERAKEDAKLLYFDGRTIEECARLVQMPETTVRQWCTRLGWTEERKRIEQLALRMSQKVEKAHQAVFERVSYGKTTHRMLAKVSRKQAKAFLDVDPLVLVEHAGGFKAAVEANKTLHPEQYAEEQGNKFAVNISLSKVLESKECRELTDAEATEWEED